MGERFNLDEFNVRSILDWVHQLQIIFNLVAGALLIALPIHRFGPSYQFLVAIPAGKEIFGALYVAAGVGLWVALKRGNKRRMARMLFISAVLNFIFFLFIIVGAMNSPIGAMGPVYILYVSTHLLIQSVLMSSRKT